MCDPCYPVYPQPCVPYYYPQCPPPCPPPPCPPELKLPQLTQLLYSGYDTTGKVTILGDGANFWDPASKTQTVVGRQVTDTAVTKGLNYPPTATYNTNVYGGSPDASLPLGTKMEQSGAVYRVVYHSPGYDNDENPAEVGNLTVSDWTFDRKGTIKAGTYSGSLQNGKVTITLPGPESNAIPANLYKDGYVTVLGETLNGLAYTFPVHTSTAVAASGTEITVTWKTGMPGSVTLGGTADNNEAFLTPSPYLVRNAPDNTTRGYNPIGAWTQGGGINTRRWVQTRGVGPGLSVTDAALTAGSLLTNGTSGGVAGRIMDKATAAQRTIGYALVDAPQNTFSPVYYTLD